jgi:NADPH2:quinone reductase
MLAIRQHRFGAPTELRLEEVDDPQAGEGDVRIVVESAGVHLVDTHIRRGEAGGPFPLPALPMTPGREVAGVVDQLGGGVDERWRGRRVVAHLGMASGGYAELAVSPVAALHELDDGLDADAAVAMIGTGRTAMGILEVADPTAVDVVVLTAAAGGIGVLLVQAARASGATVVGLARGEDKLNLVAEMGAAIVVDYSDPGWSDAVREALGDRPVTLALDGVGGEVGRGVFELVGVGGRVVLFGFASGRPFELSVGDLFARGLTVSAAIGPRMLQRPGGLRPLETQALAEATSGRILPVIGQRYALAEAADAHEAIEKRATKGKTVLRP